MSMPRISLPVLIALLSSCANSLTTVQVGAPLPLEAGEPQDRCEEDKFIRVIPTRASAHVGIHEGGGGFETTEIAEGDVTGLAIYPYGQNTPYRLTEVFSRLGDPSLAKRHEDSVRPILDKMQ
jgi:hypothetical protein